MVSVDKAATVAVAASAAVAVALLGLCGCVQFCYYACQTNANVISSGQNA